MVGSIPYLSVNNLLQVKGKHIELFKGKDAEMMMEAVYNLTFLLRIFILSVFRNTLTRKDV